MNSASISSSAQTINSDRYIATLTKLKARISRVNVGNIFLTTSSPQLRESEGPRKTTENLDQVGRSQPTQWQH
jgi:hypothetical protein